VQPDPRAPAQLRHQQSRPFYFSVVLEEKTLRFEFLVRSSHNMHCTCIAWANAGQRQFVLDYADRLLTEEMIRA